MVEVHYMLKAIYTLGDLQAIIAKHCELLSAQHRTWITGGCLTFFCFVTFFSMGSLYLIHVEMSEPTQ
jgi:hypothetical protein